MSITKSFVLSFTERLTFLGDVFAGAGPIAIAAARKVHRVYANDLNPAAVDYLQSNVSLNKLDRKVKVGGLAFAFSLENRLTFRLFPGVQHGREAVHRNHLFLGDEPPRTSRHPRGHESAQGCR